MRWTHSLTPALQAVASFSLETQGFKLSKEIMLPESTFRGRTALVTGGGTGLGKAMALNLAKLGANVFILSRKPSVLKETMEELRKKSGNSHVEFAAADVRDPDAIEAALAICESTFGSPPDLIINNAAGNFISPTERLSAGAFSSVIDIVLKGTVNVTMATAKRLMAVQKPASYVCISTVYASTGSSFVVPSAIAKAGVETLVKSLAAEWSHFGLRFNAVAPGPIYTKGAFSRLDPTGQFSKSLAHRLPAKRLGEPEELANLVSYLLSDYASWMTGEIIKFDGGEVPAMSGEFNILKEHVSPKDWDAIEKIIRGTKGS